MGGDEQISMVVVMPAKYAYRVDPVPGSSLVTANCGHRAFLAASSAEFLAGEGVGAYVVCSDCAAPEMLRDAERVEGVPGAGAELERELGVAEADQVRARMRDLGVTIPD